jgi:hypothetical protein
VAAAGAGAGVATAGGGVLGGGGATLVAGGFAAAVGAGFDRDAQATPSSRMSRHAQASDLMVRAPFT